MLSKQQFSKQDTQNNMKNNVEENNIKILIASDIHLGYEQTIKRAQEDDSFRTFQEILQYAKDSEVDMVLLGGDLFHEAKPPHNVIMRCIDLLRTYCLSDKPVKIQLLTDPELVFNHCNHKKVNYEDPNLNVGIPIFSIHGNHDDPSFGTFGSLDVLAATGLINYFGKWTDVTQVLIPPLLISKGVTTIALYGLSYMNDQRLSRLMRNEKFHMLRTDEVKDPFNIFVLHQNRTPHNRNSFIPENLLPEFLHLVIWGHEHECLITPETSKLNKKIQISQPGSSVATSLTHGEAVSKHVGILSIYKNNYKMESLKLRTVRPFIFKDVILNDYINEITTFKSRSEAVEEFIDNYIENTIIVQAAEQQTGHPEQPKKPLIRLRIFYTDDRDIFDTLRLSQKYYHVVANPNDIILYRKCSLKFKKKDIQKVESQDFGEIEEIFRSYDSTKDWRRTIQGGMTDYFSQDDKVNKLTVLSLNGLNEALLRFVNTNDTKSFHDLVKYQMKKTVKHLINDNYKDKKEVLMAIQNYRNLRLQKQQEEKIEEQSFFDARSNIALRPIKNNSLFQKEENFNINSSIDNKIEEEPMPSRRRNRNRGKKQDTNKTQKSTNNSTKQFSNKSWNLSTALNITASDRSNNSIFSWKKPNEIKSQISSKQTIKKSVILDSDSD